MSELLGKVTTLGESAISQNGVVATEFAVGSGTDPIDVDQTELQNEEYRADISNQIFIPATEDLDAHAVVDCHVPNTEGGFNITEVGVFDNNGVLISIDSVYLVPKYDVASGQPNEFLYKFRIFTGSASDITAQIDPTLIHATREYVRQQIAEYHANPTHSRIAERWRNF